MSRYLVMLGVLLVLAASLAAGSIDEDNQARPSKERVLQAQEALTELSIDRPYLKAYKTGDMVTRIYGQTFGGGLSAVSAAEQFVNENAAVFGVESSDLVSGAPFERSMTVQPIFYEQETGRYKFDLVYYRQEIGGIPVFQSELRLLARNEANHPLVLAVSTLKDLGDFAVDAAARGGYYAMAENAVRNDEPGLTDFGEQEVVIFAGDADKWAQPRMGVTFIASSDFPEKFKYVVDINTGEILYKENKIIFEDVVGRVRGMATPGPKAMQCTASTLQAFPYAWVEIIGGGGAYADDRSNFVITNGGTGPVQVVSEIRGQYFEVFNYLGAEVADTVTVTPPGPVNFIHNSIDMSEHVRAQVNGYVNANEVRDWILTYNPSYPTISTQVYFPVSVNRTDGYCPGNAWYDGSSINFCESSSEYGNTSFASVSQHEYGHHLVNMGGSGQGQYGEGMSDVVAMLIADDPGLGYGFYYDQCDTPLRNADNDMQYPCSGAIHYCGMLMSGCVWSTRNELVATHPTEYMAILGNLAVNAVLLHTGTDITPQITIDYLTIDDDDGNIANGTPHYWGIAAGFGAHNMDAPALALLVFSYPGGIPEMLAPNQTVTFEVVIEAQESEPVSGTGTMFYAIDGGGFTSVAMTETSANHYEAVLPAMDCFQTIEFYFTAEETGGATVYDPTPGMYYTAFVATDKETVFFDDFESDLGWTMQPNWARGAATSGGGEYGSPDPGTAVSGTDVMGYNLGGDYENYMSEVHATSPAIDCSDLVGGTLHFWRWLGVEQPAYDHAYINVSTNGTSWSTIWANDATVEDGSWTLYEYDISSYVDGEPTVYIRFTMGGTDGSWRYCGWNLDDVELFGYSCSETSLQIVTETLPDWTAGIAYSVQLEAANVAGTAVWADRDGDLAGTGLSLATDGLLSGVPIGADTIDFVAQVTDDAKSVAEKPLSILINPQVRITTSTLPEWTEAVAYSQQLTATDGTGEKTWSDLNGDLSGTGLALSADGLLSGVPSSAGTISFTAVATDEVGDEDQQPLSVLINPAVAITTTSLPDGVDGVAYSEQLYATGGTGAPVWSDKYNDLSGTGLSLSMSGEVTGTPTGVQSIAFTAVASDDVGGSGEMPLTINVVASFICGDINNNGTGPDIEDLTYLVLYMFQDGPAPEVMVSADANGNGAGPDIEDLVYLVEYMFQDGPDLICQ